MLKDLITDTVLSPNHSGKRTAKIDRITIHCMVAPWTAKRCGESFKDPARKASSNLGIGDDGSVGLYVPIEYRSWCSSSNANDQRAITIEVASSTKAPYTVSAKATASLIKVLTELVKEHPGLGGKLVWVDNAKQPGNITVHRWFSKTECPGSHLFNKLGDFAKQVNAAVSTVNKSTDLVAVAKDVYAGRYGNGQARIDALKKAGYTSAEITQIQTHVNNRAWNTTTQNGSSNSAPTTPAGKTDAQLKAVAKDVANGRYGNGTARINALTKAGYTSAEITKIQGFVNTRSY